MQQWLKARVVHRPLTREALLVFALISAACTQYKVVADDGGSEHAGSGGAAGSVGGGAGSTMTGKGGAGGLAGSSGSGGMTPVDGSVPDAPSDSAVDKPGVDAPSDTGTFCPGSTCVAPPSSIWTIGALVGTSTACPAGYSSTATTIHTGVSVGCASGCGCTTPVTGSCFMSFNMTLPIGNGNFTVFGEMQCTAAWSGNDIATQISANQPASFNACSNATSCPCDGRVCPNCDPTGATAPLPAWQTSMNFCPLASGAATCPSGQCAPTATKICLLAAGTQPCPAGFTAMGASGSWATGATSAGAACTCGGCGVASGESCAGTTMTVGYGVCTPGANPGSSLAGQFKGDGTSPAVNNASGWVASELFPALAGAPTPGVCGAAQAVPSGGYTPTGRQTVCCL